MISKLFRPVGLKAASIVLMLASLVSYVAGLLRDLILSYYFGASGETDVYYTAFLVPDLVFNLTVAGILAGVFIPLFRRQFLEDEEEAAKLAGAFLLSSQLLVLVVSAIAFFAMPWITKTFFGEADVVQQMEIVKLSRIMLLSPVVFAISNSLGALLMSFKHYLSYALSPGLYNIGIITGILLWHEKFGIFAAAYGVVLGLVLHFAIRFIDLHKLKFKLDWNLRAKGLGEMYRLGVPKMLGMVFLQLSVWVYNILGYGLASGSITAYNYARNIQSFAVSLFGIAVATAVFPFLVDNAASKNEEGLIEKIEFSTGQILFFTIPSAVGVGLLAEEIVAFLFKRGEFDENALLLTAGILFFFAVSIPFESMFHLLSRVYYAFKNTWFPVLVNVLFLVINIIVAFKLVDSFGPNVFAISFSAGCVFQVISLFVGLRKYVNINLKFLIRQVGLIGISSGLMAGMILLIGDRLPVLGVIAVAGSFYLVITKMFGIFEYAGLEKLNRLKRMFKK